MAVETSVREGLAALLMVVAACAEPEVARSNAAKTDHTFLAGFQLGGASIWERGLYSPEGAA
jgi:hypothetical protein